MDPDTAARRHPHLDLTTRAHLHHHTHRRPVFPTRAPHPEAGTGDAHPKTHPHPRPRPPNRVRTRPKPGPLRRRPTTLLTPRHFAGCSAVVEV
jgi:hypothetical protein